MSLGNRLKELRNSKQLSMQELASFFNTSKVSISYWESGKRQPKDQYLIKYAQFFDVPFDWVKYGNDKTKINKYFQIDKTAKEIVNILNEHIKCCDSLANVILEGEDIVLYYGSSIPEESFRICSFDCIDDDSEKYYEFGTSGGGIAEYVAFEYLTSTLLDKDTKLVVVVKKFIECFKELSELIS